jgi:high-affinity iron transporter
VNPETEELLDVWADALPNLAIGLREGLEAGLVVSILLAALRKQDSKVSSAPIWLGVAAAVVLALSFGAVLTFYESVLSTTGQEALGGSLSVLAVFLVTWMIFWMRRTARSLTGELREKVASALSVNMYALAITAFLAVGREGLETALFLWTAAQASGTTVAPMIGAALGIAIAVVLCVLLYRRAVKIRLDKFFNRTAVILIVIAAGVLSYGLGDLQDAGVLPGHLWVAFNVSAHLSDSTWWVALIRGVTNLEQTMTWLQVVAYLCYLAVVLAMFGRASHVTAPAPSPGRSPRIRLGRRGAVALTCTALVAPPLAAGVLIAAAPSSTATAQVLKVTATSCGAEWTSAKAGAQTFTVQNDTSQAAEINLDTSPGDGIAAEIETLGPGTKESMTTTLAAGTKYLLRCLISGQQTTESATLTAAGTAGTSAAADDDDIAAPGSNTGSVTPPTVAELTPALDRYTAYVQGKLATLQTQATKIEDDLRAGNLAQAREDWVPADLTWELVGEEPYGSFGDYGNEIDAGPQRFINGVNDSHFTGLRRLEYGLWHGQSAAELRPRAATLVTDVAGLRKNLNSVNVDTGDFTIRAHEVLEDALRDKLTGQDDLGSNDTYQELLADVQVTKWILGDLSNVIQPRAPRLLPTADSELASLTSALEAMRSPDGTWVSVQSATLAQKQRIDAAIGESLETLSAVPDLLETAAH